MNEEKVKEIIENISKYFTKEDIINCRIALIEFLAFNDFTYFAGDYRKTLMKLGGRL